MAKAKTMIAADVVSSETFMRLSHSAQALYQQLNANTDHQGVTNNAFLLMSGGGFEQEHLDELIQAGFIIQINHDEKRIEVIAHYWIMNKLDRRNFYPSQYQAVLSKQVCMLEGSRVYVSVACLPQGYVLTDKDGEIPGYRRAVCNQSGSSLETVSNNFETNIKKEIETVPAPKLTCPECGKPAATVPDETHGLRAECVPCNFVFYEDEDGVSHTYYTP